MRAAAVSGQIAQGVVADQDHVPPAPPIAAVGAALGYVRLTAKTEAAVTAGASLDVDTSSIVHTQTMADSVFLITGASSGTGVMFAVSQPPHVDVNEILVRPTAQDS